MSTNGRYAVEVIADDSGKWAGNALRFESLAEAEIYARGLWARWTAVREWHVVDLAAYPVVVVAEGK